MNDPQRLYEKIYQILITKGVDVLADYIKKRDLDDYAINAIRTLASLPDPRVVTRREAVKIAMECISRSLEFCYQTENIGKLAHQLREQLEQEPKEFIDLPLGVSSNTLDGSGLESMLMSNNSMLLNLTTAVSKIAATVDIDLKGQCPYCQGPLVEVLVNTGGMNWELRLRCKKQTKPDCRNSDWFLQNTQVKVP